MTEWSRRAWAAFRRWPNWAQVLGWLLGWWLLVPLLIWRSQATTGMKALGTAVVWIVFVVAMASAGTNDQRQTLDVASPPAESPNASSPAPSVQPSVAPKKAPDVTGVQVDKAEARLGELPFTVQVLIEEQFSSKPEGLVLRQTPVPGSDLTAGDTVQLVVAKPFPLIPNVVAKILSAARRTLERAGFGVQVRKQVSSQRPGTVISQQPSGGTEARPGRDVTVIVAKAPPPECTPGYSPCLVYHGGADYDCYGGSGDGPYYTEPGVTYSVSGSDPYGLDGNDNDGYGCE